jgi:hypothetical protein
MSFYGRSPQFVRLASTEICHPQNPWAYGMHGIFNWGNCIITNFKKREMLIPSTPINTNLVNTNLGAAVEKQYRSL